jgi:hypothetical protein
MTPAGAVGGVGLVPTRKGGAAGDGAGKSWAMWVAMSGECCIAMPAVDNLFGIASNLMKIKELAMAIAPSKYFCDFLMLSTSELLP